MVVSARAHDYLRSWELGKDPEALHWQGWNPEDIASDDQPLVGHRPSRDEPDVLLPLRGFLHFSAIVRNTRQVAGAIDIHRHGAEHRVGTIMGLEYRGAGYGTEFLREVTRLAHRHFGIRRITAGYEAVNTASERWLAKVGFVPAQGPAEYTLANGRVVRSLWREHVDEDAKLRCPWLTEAGEARVRALVPVNPAPDDSAGHLNALMWQREQQIGADSCPWCIQPMI